MYKPSNTWINDALRFCAECWISVIHLAELDEGDMNENLRELISLLTVIRRQMIQKIVRYCPDMNAKLTCVATKHIPAIVHYGIEVMNSSPEDMGDLMLSARRAKVLAFQEFSGIPMKESGCPECLNELNLSDNNQIESETDPQEDAASLLEKDYYFVELYEPPQETPEISDTVVSLYKNAEL